MSVITDLSLMDILFDKDEHVKLEPKSDDIKVEDKSTTVSIKLVYHKAYLCESFIIKV